MQGCKVMQIQYQVHQIPQQYNVQATMNQHPPMHHPLDACMIQLMDDPQLNYNPIIIMLTHSIRSTSNI